MDSEATLLDYKIVLFNTTETDFETTAQGGKAPDEDGDPVSTFSLSPLLFLSPTLLLSSPSSSFLLALSVILLLTVF